MRFWQDFLDSLNSDGGHILNLTLLVCLGMVAMFYQLPKGEDLFIGALAGLLVMLKTAGSNKTRRDRPLPESTTTLEATTAGPKPPDINLDPGKEV